MPSKMIVVRSPTRISLAGGGTDLPAFARFYGSDVVNVAVDNLVTTIIDYHRDQSKIEIDYVDRDILDVDRDTPSRERRVDPRRHVLVSDVRLLALDHRPFFEALERAKIGSGVAITCINSATDSGIGLRGARHVSLLHAAYAFAGKNVGKEQLAHEAVQITRTVHNDGGYQDEYAASYGGVNHWSTDKSDTVVRRNLDLRGTALTNFMNCTSVFISNTPSYYSLLTAEAAKMDSKVFEFNKLRSLARQVVNPLLGGNMEKVGNIVQEDWEIKQGLDPVVATPEVRRLDKIVKEEGAWGTKQMGPGGVEGARLVIHPEEKRARIRDVCVEEGLVPVEVQIDYTGSRAVPV